MYHIISPVLYCVILLLSLIYSSLWIILILYFGFLYNQPSFPELLKLSRILQFWCFSVTNHTAQILKADFVNCLISIVQEFHWLTSKLWHGALCVHLLLINILIFTVCSCDELICIYYIFIFCTFHEYFQKFIDNLLILEVTFSVYRCARILQITACHGIVIMKSWKQSL